jgi:UDP-N-acetylmuramate--alanine ligase
MNLSEIKRLYFLGIGGIGMSALARYFLNRGCEVHGYDKTKTTLTKKLAKEGMKVHYDENTGIIPPDVDLAIWTPAVPRTHKAFEWLQKHGVPLKKRAEVLGMLSREKRCIAVAGTHGKTTTSSMIAHLLHTGGVDCTAFLGGIVQNFGSNYVGGKSEWMVAEADEYDRSFLQLSPEISVLLSMDPDHLDIYGEASAVAETGFKEFIKKNNMDGKVFMHINLAQYFENQLFETFGIGEGQYRAENVRVENGSFVFDFVAASSSGHTAATGLKGLRLPMPGRHNVENATAAIAVALQLGVNSLAIRKGLLTFKGIKRRFEFIFRDEKTVFIDDYAHHPTEIRAAVLAARELFPGRKITGIFQPHLFTRTRDFQDGFAEELDKLDEILLMDIYPARELPIPGVTSEIIFDKMKNPNKVLVTKANTLDVLKTKHLDVLMTIGAGDIDTLVGNILKWLKKRSS